MDHQPLVSVGIPTYNRPEGLRRTLKCITQQTYKNLEIIISDNNSSNSEVIKVLEEFRERDNRIKYFRQKENIGAAKNFNFVLKKATGIYFMWAADDDEWEEEFIKFCCSNIGDHSSIMTGYSTKFRAKGYEKINIIPYLNNSQTVFQNTFNFLQNIHSSLIYGVHKRNTIEYFLHDYFFDYYDCYFVTKQIIQGNFITFPEMILYHAGIDAEEYVVKPAKKKSGKLFEYHLFFLKTASLIRRSHMLNFREKIKLIHVLMNSIITFFCRYELPHRPFQVKIIKFISLGINLNYTLKTRLRTLFK